MKKYNYKFTKKKKCKDEKNQKLLNKKVKRDNNKIHKKIKKKIIKFKSCKQYKNKNKLKSFNPDKIQLLDSITNDSFVNVLIDNTFITFKSIEDILYLIYTNNILSIISYNLNTKQKICEIKNKVGEYISSFRHYLDKNNNMDIIMSIFCSDNSIRLRNVKNLECILYISNINNRGCLYSACFLNDDDNNNYIVTCNLVLLNIPEPIKIYDFNGNKIKEINESNDNTFFIDFFYDNLISKKFIITGNKGSVKSYDYNNNKLYIKYSDYNNEEPHCYIIIYNNKNIIKLIESCDDGYIRIWNFHMGLLLNKINIENQSINGICLWNKNYLFVGCNDQTIKLIKIKKGKIIKSLLGHNSIVCTIKKINHYKYGECLISQGFLIDKINIWYFSN